MGRVSECMTVTVLWLFRSPHGAMGCPLFHINWKELVIKLIDV